MADITEQRLRTIVREEIRPTHDLVLQNTRVINEHEKKIEKNTKYLYGNGEPGFDERLRNIERTLNNLMKVLSLFLIPLSAYVIVEAVKILLSHF